MLVERLAVAFCQVRAGTVLIIGLLIAGEELMKVRFPRSF